MTQPTKWSAPLGSGADVQDLPDDDLRYASFSKIFPQITQVPLSAGGVAPRRIDFNSLFKLLADNIYYYQNGGVFEYSDTADYVKGRIVLYTDNNIYLCIQDNGSSNPKPPTNSAYWSKLLSISDLSGYVTNPVNSDLFFNNALRILRNDNDQYLIFIAGNNSSTSSSITINGINRDNGNIDIIARDSNSNANSLTISANGTITWDTNDIRTIMANSAMPSDTYTDLSVGSSDSTYTAPKNGYFYAYGVSTNENAFLQLVAKVGMRCFVTLSTYNLSVFIPVKKNDVMTLTYQNIKTENITLRFIECIRG